MSDDEAVLAVLRPLRDVYREEGIVLWMAHKRPRWGGLTAYQMIEAGRTSEVLQYIETLAGGPVSSDDSGSTDLQPRDS